MAEPVSQLSGVVRDATGGVLPASRDRHRRGAGRSAHCRHERARPIRLDELPAGRYLITASLSGFEQRTAEIDIGARPGDARSGACRRSFSERVTVTATKTGAADVQSTPIAVTVLPARTLEQLGVQTVGVSPASCRPVTISQHTGAAQVTIRGIGTNSTVVGADPSSTVHLDGVYLGRPVMVFSSS